MLLNQVGSVCGGEDWPDLVEIQIQSVKPSLQCFGIVVPIQAPVIHNTEILLEIEQEVIGGHRSPWEEVPCHPFSIWASVGVELIGKFPVTQNLHKEQSSRAEPPSNTVHQLFIVFHVLLRKGSTTSIQGPGFTVAVYSSSINPQPGMWPVNWVCKIFHRSCDHRNHVTMLPMQFVVATSGLVEFTKWYMPLVITCFNGSTLTMTKNVQKKDTKN